MQPTGSLVPTLKREGCSPLMMHTRSSARSTPRAFAPSVNPALRSALHDLGFPCLMVKVPVTSRTRCTSRVPLPVSCRFVPTSNQACRTHPSLFPGRQGLPASWYNKSRATLAAGLSNVASPLLAEGGLYLCPRHRCLSRVGSPPSSVHGPQNNSMAKSSPRAPYVNSPQASSSCEH